MPGPDFLDTNVLVSAYDVSDPAKQRTAQELVRKAVTGGLVISTQVLAEFAATLLHKLAPAPSTDDVIALLDTLAPIRLITPDGDTVRRAVEARAAYGLHFYDGMIIAAAERAGSERIWSEDFNPGQKYFGVVAANPFQ
ncbi:MAG TPA: PIN domain-containing protein [Terriglobales bacterium]|jgi:predicted nucleic acid-binding protein|nr:PIN domain-containing protein [Terriglobales bacterium]